VNQPLPKPLRTQLENTVKAARDVAESAARAALAQLAVADDKVPDYLSEPQRILRRKLRAHARALSANSYQSNSVETRHLVWEVAYEHWHRMLFARFLAENHLLLWEPGAPVTLAECDELVQEPSTSLGAKSGWELAGKLAARMLPQVFKPNNPVYELVFAPEHQRALEKLLAGLPVDVFTASDSLGWVYQFWQAKRKDEVNASEVKIGADELPAVTQLFTEPYMVDFLLHNSLGAWWATRHPGKSCPVPLTYLRTLDDGTPAAGNFEGWPNSLKDFKLLDPCCGSGHFLVAAFLLLVPMRMASEGLSAMDAVDAVLAENLHGLELDARCVEIAVFALALAAWRFPDENGDPLGVRADMPAPQVACCGLKVAAKPEDWAALVPDHAANAEHLREGLRRLHRDFSQAPLLGSLLDPSKASGDLFAADFSLLAGLLEEALQAEHQPELWDDGIGAWDNALTARGLLDAARLLGASYHLVITNVPYLSRGKQSEALKDYCAEHYPEAKNDLANVFLERCLELAHDRGQGVVQIVMPQNWLFLTSYKKQRESLLKRVEFNLVTLLGPKGFQTPMWDFNVQLLTVTNVPAATDFQLRGVDASAPRSTTEKAELLRSGAEVLAVSQKGQLGNPDAVIVLSSEGVSSRLGDVAVVRGGTTTGDAPFFRRLFWELSDLAPGLWARQQGPVSKVDDFTGREYLLLWEGGAGRLAAKANGQGATVAGRDCWGKQGVAIGKTGSLAVTRFTGEVFENVAFVLIPKDQKNLPAIWSFCSSPEFSSAVRTVNQALCVDPGYYEMAEFSLAHWQQVADQRYPNGLPQPYSDDPTQWLFHGHPQPAIDPLQVAVARLAGYRWPAELDATMELATEARTWIARCDALASHVDDDGIVCLPSVRGEKPASERLLSLLITAWETTEPGSWKPSTLDKLLTDAGCAGKGLDVWLRDHFFEQHAKRFQHRPFIWHVWDGLKDGFAALVNYHRLDAKNLERLIHTYLGDWIRNQEAGVANGTDGAPLRLSAALALKTKLAAIQLGEFDGKVGYDIFVRWKPLAEQPIGWTPDLNDGVRMNIRPFMTAEVLRHNKKPKLNITWDKDRGKDVASAPWFKVFNGDRINDYHLTLAEKMTAKREPGAN
jgi:hypothetical protein